MKPEWEPLCQTQISVLYHRPILTQVGRPADICNSKMMWGHTSILFLQENVYPNY